MKPKFLLVIVSGLTLTGCQESIDYQDAKSYTDYVVSSVKKQETEIEESITNYIDTVIPTNEIDKTLEATNEMLQTQLDELTPKEAQELYNEFTINVDTTL